MAAQRHGASTEQNVAIDGIVEEVLELLILGAVRESEYLGLSGLDAFRKCGGVEVLAHDFRMRAAAVDIKVDLSNIFLALALRLLR